MAESFIETHLQTLKNLFPNLDPDYLESIAIECEHDEEALQEHIEDLLDPDSSHPTRDEWVSRKRNQQTLSSYTDSFSVQKFLKKFPDKDPHNYFSNVKKSTELGKAHADLSLSYLKKRYPHVHGDSIMDHLVKHRYSLVDTVGELDDIKPCRHRCYNNNNQGCRSRGMVSLGESGDVNTAFLQEVAYIEHKEEIEDYLNTMAIYHIQKFEQAKEMDMLCQCECCFDTEILEDETVSCTKGHLFCEPCVQKYVEIRIGDGATDLPCMSAQCGAGEFSLKTVKLLIEPQEFSAFVRRKQLEEIKSAGIDDLESCPFCGFTNIVEENSKVFVCLEDQCRKESCRKCNKESHLPFECHALEKSQDRTRKYVEDKLSAALIRECYRCHKKFVKENSGCNHITCPGCASHMCYVCRQPLDPEAIYTHFVGQGGPEDSKKCPLYSNANLLHVEALENVAQAVDRQIRQENPQARVDVSSYVPDRLKGGQQNLPGAREQRDMVLQHTLRAVNLK